MSGWHGKKMIKARHRLTQETVDRMLKNPFLKHGRYHDGSGLYLVVRDVNSRSWLYTYSLHYKRKAIGLGSAHIVTLTEARNAAQECRRILARKICPLELRRFTHAVAS